MAAAATSACQDECKARKETRPVCEAYTSTAEAYTSTMSAPASVSADEMKDIVKKDAAHKEWKRAEKGNNKLVAAAAKAEEKHSSHKV